MKRLKFICQKYFQSSVSPAASGLLLLHELTKHTLLPPPTWRVLVAEIAGFLPGFQMFSACIWGKSAAQTCLYSYLTRGSVRYMKRGRPAVIDLSEHCCFSVFDYTDCVLRNTDIYKIKILPRDWLLIVECWRTSKHDINQTHHFVCLMLIVSNSCSL